MTRKKVDPDICTASSRTGEVCVLAAGHAGHHRDQYDEEWPAGAKGAKEHQPKEEKEEE